MTLSRNTRRRLTLYGVAALVVVACLAIPRAVLYFAPRFRVRAFDVSSARGDEATRLLVEYVRIPTENPPGRTREAVAFWARLFACEGIPFEIVGDDPERPIFVARLAGKTRKEALLLLHHMDVYPVPDAHGWRKPPFAGEMGTAEDYAYLYGRGTLDMKNLGVTFFLALAQLRRDGIEPLRDVVFVAEPGEESFTPEIGIGWLMDHRPDLLEGVTDVFNEGGVNEVIGDRVERFGIEVLQKGTISCMAEAGRKEDLEAFGTFLDARMPLDPYRVTDEAQEFLHFIGPSRSDLWGHFMNDARAAVRAGKFGEGLPEVYRSLMRDMYYTGAVEPRAGGFERAVVATVLPGRSVAARWGELQGWARERGIRLRLKFLTRDSVPTPRTGRAWAAVSTALRLDPERAEVGIYFLTATYTDSSYLRNRGLRVFGISPFLVNIVDAVRVHRTNERIHLGNYLQGVARMKGVLLEFATAP